ncbi:zinc finger Y-chromosomal protein isoform X2 [Musca domestica]|uniref:Zinc finger Y-chromosomal protein isoform X1 n=1 Tax=Musca domestica TaxID=7370 RepID=A0A1I8N966_MUSDO|nr:zinc finger Y-chromosomal protein isoform X2 [Musca domestica]XP_019893693.1 zinc finger Y-chromosomal protein isoform X2 [Musca domestica]
MTQSTTCRLCVDKCQEYETLYDENGFGNELYEVIFSLFHPKIIDMDKYRHLNIICNKCWGQVLDFHNFQKFVTDAQERLQEEGDTKDVKTSTDVENFLVGFPDAAGDFDNSAAGNIEGSFVSLSEMAAIEADGDTPLNSLASQAAALTKRKFAQKIAQSHVEPKKSKSGGQKKGGQSLPQMPVIKMEREFELIDVHDDYDEEADMPSTSWNATAPEDDYNFHDDSSIILLDDSDEDEEVEAEEDYFNMSMSQFNADYENEEDGYEQHGLVDAIAGIDGRRDNKSREERQQHLSVLLANFMPIINCDLCSHKCKSWPALQAHFLKKHPTEQCYIPCCGRKLKEHWTLKEHMRYHNDPNTFKCKLCGRINTTRCSLKRHIDAQHPSYQKLRHFCPSCDKGFTTKSGLRYHCTTVHENYGKPESQVQPDGSTLHVCKQCSRSFKSLDMARKHIYYNHSQVDRLKCPTCGCIFKKSRPYREHVASHTKKELYICAYCPQRFTFMNALRCHRKSKHPQEPEENCYVEIYGEHEQFL